MTEVKALVAEVGWRRRGYVLEVIVTGAVIQTGLAVTVAVVVSTSNSFACVIRSFSFFWVACKASKLTHRLYPFSRPFLWVFHLCPLYFVAAFFSSWLFDFGTRPGQRELTDPCLLLEPPEPFCKALD